MTKTILFFNSSSCGPCKLAKSQLSDTFLQENDINLISISAENDFTSFAKWKVASVPTFIYIKDDTELKRNVGFKTLQDIKDLLK